MQQSALFRRVFASSLPIIAMLMAAIISSAAFGQEARVITDDEWCEDDGWNRDGERHCEVREYTLPAGTLAVDGGNNGGMAVEGWDRNEILVRAKISAHSEDNDPSDLADQVSIMTGRRVRADGPRSGRDESWWVSYRVYVPRDTDLDLEAHNGGIAIKGVSGEIRFETHNGGVKLDSLSGDVQGSTDNGGLNVALSGDNWDGRGLDVSTKNGGVRITIPDGYNAELETGTRNGGLRVDFPITVSGDIGKRLQTTLGNGGAPVRITTTNGGVRIERQ